jgi:hypothetical protein
LWRAVVADATSRLAAAHNAAGRSGDVDRFDEILAEEDRHMDAVRFDGHIRYWNPEKPGGLAVADIPSEHVLAFGGLKQQRVRGSVGGVEFASNVMPGGGGRLALSVSKSMMKAAGVGVGDDVEFTITAVGRG